MYSPFSVFGFQVSVTLHCFGGHSHLLGLLPVVEVQDGMVLLGTASQRFVAIIFLHGRLTTRGYQRRRGVRAWVAVLLVVHRDQRSLTARLVWRNTHSIGCITTESLRLAKEWWHLPPVSCWECPIDQEWTCIHNRGMVPTVPRFAGVQLDWFFALDV